MCRLKLAMADMETNCLCSFISHREKCLSTFLVVLSQQYKALGVKVATVYRHEESSAVYGFLLLFVCALGWQHVTHFLQGYGIPLAHAYLLQILNVTRYIFS